MRLNEVQSPERLQPEATLGWPSPAAASMNCSPWRDCNMCEVYRHMSGWSPQ